MRKSETKREERHRSLGPNSARCLDILVLVLNLRRLEHARYAHGFFRLFLRFGFFLIEK